MGDADDVLALGRDGFEERVLGADQVEDDLGAHGAEAGHLARLAVYGIAPHQSAVIDADHDLVARGLTGPAGQGH